MRSRMPLNSEQYRETEKKILHIASALDPSFKGLPFLTEEERLEMDRGVTEEDISLEVISYFFLENV